MVKMTTKRSCEIEINEIQDFGYAAKYREYRYIPKGGDDLEETSIYTEVVVTLLAAYRAIKDFIRWFRNR